MSILYNSVIKRFLDLVVALCAFALALPVMIVIIILLKLTKHKRVFFVQKRVGLHEEIFHLIKFRSMTDETDTTGRLLPDAKRLTSFGLALRRTSLDELPQLINVIKGDMSLVGPRPLLIEYLPRYNPEQKRRHLVRPGITGWAQVNGRNAISWEKKFALDVWYVANQSFSLDLKILILTVKNILQRRDISQPGEATMSEFRG